MERRTKKTKTKLKSSRTNGAEKEDCARRRELKRLDGKHASLTRIRNSESRNVGYMVRKGKL